jgi:pilus assembly protein FimV
LKALRTIAATLLLLGSAIPSFGLTLGPAQGAAWIGQPLNLVFPLTLDGREAGGSLCLEADIRQGDVRVDDKRFTLSLDPGPSPNTPRVHLRTTHAIVEPVVTVRLSAGCEFKSTRQYTLLADLPMTPAVVAPPVRATAPSERAPSRWTSSESDGASGSGEFGTAPAAAQRSPSRRAASSAAPTRPTRSQAERDAARTRQRASTPPVKRPPAAVARTAPPQVATPKPAAPKSEAVAPAPAEEGKSRLLIEPLAPTPAGAAAIARPTTAAPAGVVPPAPAAPAVPQAAPSPTVPSTNAGAPSAASPPPLVAPAAPASADTNSPAQVAAAGVPVLPDPLAPERDAARFKAMEDALTTLRAQSEQTQKLMLEMRSELAEARSSRYQNWLVYSLLALLAAMLLLLVFMWRSLRQAQQAAWWREGQGQVDGQPDEEADEDSVPVRRFARTTTRGPLPRHGELQDDDEDDEDDDRDEGNRRLSARAELDDQDGQDDAQVLAEGGRRGMLGGAGFERAQIRSVNTEELIDVQQQADFFMSLGEHDQAIEVLREHISSNPGTSALAYLDLLSILHSLGRKDDYVRQGAAFERQFNVALPPFDSFARQGRGLEHYPSALSRIAAVWPGAGTLELIEELLFRQPDGGEEVFDLAAYQELLLLHAVARDAAEHPTELVPTVSAALGHETEFQSIAAEAPAVDDDDGLEQTMPMPYLPDTARQTAPLIMPAVDMDMADLDRTAFQTLRAPIENLPKPAPTPASGDPHVIDFNPFDPENDEELKPGRFTIKR